MQEVLGSPRRPGLRGAPGVRCRAGSTSGGVAAFTSGVRAVASRSLGPWRPGARLSPVRGPPRAAATSRTRGGPGRRPVPAGGRAPRPRRAPFRTAGAGRPGGSRRGLRRALRAAATRRDAQRRRATVMRPGVGGRSRRPAPGRVLGSRCRPLSPRVLRDAGPLCRGPRPGRPFGAGPVPHRAAPPGPGPGAACPGRARLARVAVGPNG
ncbi:hypothetical protein EBF04_23555 [Streptomyces sp. I6]|nr:hypothetical protein EBF04_23555 [Streptomyces sp. I6]